MNNIIKSWIKKRRVSLTWHSRPGDMFGCFLTSQSYNWPGGVHGVTFPIQLIAGLSCQLSAPLSTLTMNYSVLEEERCGRLLIAARDIKAGEVIFSDTPGAVGPDGPPFPICLTCYKRLKALVYRCRHCGWPLCGPHCQEGEPHVRECQLLAKSCPK